MPTGIYTRIKPSWNKGKKYSIEHKLKIGKGVKKFYKTHSYKSGESHHRWKGGIIKHQGYVYVYNPMHPQSIIKYVKRCNLIMEKHIRRYLKKGEVVHHINHIKNDDRIENLQLFKNISDHMRYEGIGRTFSDETKKKLKENNVHYWLGKHRSKETKNKIRLSLKKYYH